MTGLSASRRSAERFGDLVDAAVQTDGGPVGTVGTVDPTTAELVALVGVLRSVPDAAPRPEFSVALRERLMLAADSEWTAAAVPDSAATDAESRARLTVPDRRRSGRDRRLAAALGAIAIIGASTSMAVASEGALPGDALYPLKRAIETTHTRLSLSDQSKGTTLLASAGDRLSEARQLTQAGDPDAGQVTASFETFTVQLSQGADLLMRDYRDHGSTASINTLRDFDAASMLQLTALEGTVPPESEPALLDAAKQLFAVDAEAGQLCPGCRAQGITEIPATLLASNVVSPLPATPDAPIGPDVSATPGVDDPGGRGRGRHHEPRSTPTSSAIATSRPSGLPSSGTSSAPTTTASGGPSLRPSRLPTVKPTVKATPTSLLSSLIDDVPTRTSQPTVTALPTVVPTGVVSDVASAVATSVGHLLDGLTE